MALEAQAPTRHLRGRVPPMSERILARAEIGTFVHSILVAGAMPLSIKLDLGGHHGRPHHRRDTQPPLPYYRCFPANAVTACLASLPPMRLRLVFDDTRCRRTAARRNHRARPLSFDLLPTHPRETARVHVGRLVQDRRHRRQRARRLHPAADRKKELRLSGGFNVHPLPGRSGNPSLPRRRDVAVVGARRGRQ